MAPARPAACTNAVTAFEMSLSVTTTGACGGGGSGASSSRVIHGCARSCASVDRFSTSFVSSPCISSISGPLIGFPLRPPLPVSGGATTSTHVRISCSSSIGVGAWKGGSPQSHT